MTLSTRHEFETIPAWTILAGSSAGGWSSREVCAELIRHCQAVTSNTPDSWWQDLAEYSDENIDEMDSLTFDCIEHLECNALLPESCSITWRDNELTVLPYLDEELPRYDINDFDRELYTEDIIYGVTDHGNVTCYRWQQTLAGNGEYEPVWDMV